MERIEVEPGFLAYAPNGQFLVVSNQTACGIGDTLFHTRVWAEKEAATKVAWANRSWLRKIFGMAPKGYEYDRNPSPIFGIALQLFGL